MQRFYNSNETIIEQSRNLGYIANNLWNNGSWKKPIHVHEFLLGPTSHTDLFSSLQHFTNTYYHLNGVQISSVYHNMQCRKAETNKAKKGAISVSLICEAEWSVLPWSHITHPTRTWNSVLYHCYNFIRLELLPTCHKQCTFNVKCRCNSATCTYQITTLLFHYCNTWLKIDGQNMKGKHQL